MIHEEIQNIVNALNEIGSKNSDIWKSSVDSITKIKNSLDAMAYYEDFLSCFLFDIQNLALVQEGETNEIQKIIDKYTVKVKPGEAFKTMYDMIQQRISGTPLIPPSPPNKVTETKHE